MLSYSIVIPSLFLFIIKCCSATVAFIVSAFAHFCLNNFKRNGIFNRCKTTNTIHTQLCVGIKMVPMSVAMAVAVVFTLSFDCATEIQ